MPDAADPGDQSPARPVRARGRRWAKAALGLLLLGGATVAADRLLPPDLSRAADRSTVVAAADGTTLRAYLTPDGKWRLPATIRDVDPRYLRLLLAYEDQRFRDHAGVDPLAVARAAWQFASNLGVVSGASTITMQVARLLEPLPRDLGGKAVQAARAMQLEARLTKDEILGLYLTLAPFGGNVEGARAASLAYFGKEPTRLTLSESALLVALPQSPERNRPDRFPERAKAQRDKVLRILAERGAISAADAAEAMEDPVPTARRPLPFSAPHFADAARRARPDAKDVATTIDARIQAQVERVLAEEAAAASDGGDFAAVVVENATSRIVAYAGSADFWREGGQVDLAASARSPGSTLKPFIYGLAFDDLIVHPATLIEDRPISFDGYAPRNFDRGFQGTVTVREALHQSLNVPAVSLLERVGANRLAATFQLAGARLVWPTKLAGPSLPMALGGVGIRLSDLTMLFAGVANDGVVRPLRRFADEDLGAPQRIFGPAAAWYLWDVLKDAPLPDGWAMAQGLERERIVAFKTGTSYGFRDAWTVGFSNRYTVGVWAGRADGSTRPGRMGRNEAAPAMFRVFDALPGEPLVMKSKPEDAIAALNADQLPPSLQRFSPRVANPGLARAVPPPTIAFPPDGAVVELADATPPMLLKAQGGAQPLRWVIDGVPLPANPRGGDPEWTPAKEGFVAVTVVDAQGRAATSKIRLKRAM